MRSWYRRNDIELLDLRLEFTQGIYLLAELSFDDSDLGVFNIDYIDRLIELDRKSKNIDWASPAAIIDRRMLMPVPDAMLEHLKRESVEIEFDLRAVAQSFLSYLEEQSSLTLFINDSYGIRSLSGESIDEFRRLCRDYANAEKSERSLELGTVFERKIEQAVGRLQVAASPALNAKEEMAIAHADDFRLACKSLLSKAINLQFLEHGSDEVESPDAYVSALTAEIETVAASLEHFVADFQAFASELLESFSEIELEISEKVENINAVASPLSKCSIKLLRVSHVWLPYWRAEYTLSGEERTLLLKAV